MDVDLLNPDVTNRDIIYVTDGGMTPLDMAGQLAAWGLVPAQGTLPCPKCGKTMMLGVDNNRIDSLWWTCDKRSSRAKQKAKKCRKTVEFPTGTFFAKSKLPLHQILGFAHFWAEGSTLRLAGKECRISDSHTLVDWASFCREVVLDAFILHLEKLGGPGMVVEIDESKFGKRKYHRGHHVDGVWVFGRYERGTGRVFMVPVEDRSTSTLLPIIQEWIKPGTTIHSDLWKAYNCLEDEGFHHLSINHSLNFKDPETGVHTNAIESSWRAAKSSMPSGGRIKGHIAGNLARYMFQKKCREMNVDPTLEFFRLAGQLYDARITTSEDEEDGPANESEFSSTRDEQDSDVDEFGDIIA